MACNICGKNHVLSFKDYITEMAAIKDAATEDVNIRDLVFEVYAYSFLDKKQLEIYNKQYHIDKNKKHIGHRLSKLVHKELVKRYVSDVDGELVFDEKKMIADYTKVPQELLGTNGKLSHSGGDAGIFYKISIPAFRGLMYDQQEKKWIVVATCPKADICGPICAMNKGQSIGNETAELNKSRMLSLLFNHPKEFIEILRGELGVKLAKASMENKKVWVRWHEAGDWCSKEYFNMAMDFARSFIDDKRILFYAYTKSLDMLVGASIPENFRFVKSHGGKMDSAITGEDKQAFIVSKKLWKTEIKDLNAKEKGQGERETPAWRFSPDDEKKLKNIIMTTPGLGSTNPKRLITFDEMQKIEPKFVAPDERYDVIVWPGHGDDAAVRPDVKIIYLLEH